MNLPRNIPDLAAWKSVAGDLLAAYPTGGVFGLRGDLGAGKTTFVRAIVEAIAVKNGRPAPRVVSPSFVFRQPYHELTPTVDHFDLYRLEQIDEATLRELGVLEAVGLARDKKGFVFIEWPEKIRPGLLSLDRTWEISAFGNGRRLS